MWRHEDEEQEVAQEGTMHHSYCIGEEVWMYMVTCLGGYKQGWKGFCEEWLQCGQIQSFIWCMLDIVWEAGKCQQSLLDYEWSGMEETGQVLCQGKIPQLS